MEFNLNLINIVKFSCFTAKKFTRQNLFPTKKTESYLQHKFVIKTLIKNS